MSVTTGLMLESPPPSLSLCLSLWCVLICLWIQASPTACSVNPLPQQICQLLKTSRKTSFPNDVLDAETATICVILYHDIIRYIFFLKNICEPNWGSVQTDE